MFDWSSTDRIVAKTDIDGEVEVSTVFLGLDHAVWDGPPMLFETMIFGGPHDNSQWRTRCASRRKQATTRSWPRCCRTRPVHHRLRGPAAR